MADLPNDAKVRKIYFKALMIVHEDKVMNKPEEIKYIANKVTAMLNVANEEF